jgi:hypothetical protein
VQKIIFSIVLLLVFTSSSFAQIKITNATFPKPGDTLKTIFSAVVPGALQLGSTGGPKNWDFSQLKNGIKQQEIYKLPSAGKDAAFFPDVNLLMISDGQEFYIKSTAQMMEGLGIGGSNEILDTSILIKYNKRPVLRKAPLEFINTTFSQGEFRIDLNARIIPDSLLQDFPVKPDSIRLQVSNTLRGMIDAYGTLKIHGKNYEVLREKAEVITEAKVFIKVLGIWLDLLTLAGDNIPEQFSNILGRDTTIAYNFYNNTKKETIVSATYTTNGTFLGVSFIDEFNLTSSIDQTLLGSPFNISPNPAGDYIEIRPENTEFAHSLLISDMSGRSVYFGIIEKGNNQNTRIDITDWAKGTYIAQLFTLRNTRIYSQKFIKL